MSSTDNITDSAAQAVEYAKQNAQNKISQIQQTLGSNPEEVKEPSSSSGDKVTASTTDGKEYGRQKINELADKRAAELQKREGEGGNDGPAVEWKPSS